MWSSLAQTFFSPRSLSLCVSLLLRREQLVVSHCFRHQQSNHDVPFMGKWALGNPFQTGLTIPITKRLRAGAGRFKRKGNTRLCDHRILKCIHSVRRRMLQKLLAKKWKGGGYNVIARINTRTRQYLFTYPSSKSCVQFFHLFRSKRFEIVGLQSGWTT